MARSLSRLRRSEFDERLEAMVRDIEASHARLAALFCMQWHARQHDRLDKVREAAAPDDPELQAEEVRVRAEIEAQQRRSWGRRP